jgi:hypothetical protein
VTRLGAGLLAFVSGRGRGEVKPSDDYRQGKWPAEQLQKFPAFHGTRSFIAVFTKDHHWFLILSHMSLVHPHPSYVIKIHFYIILVSMPNSSIWPLSFIIPHQNAVCG